LVGLEDCGGDPASVGHRVALVSRPGADRGGVVPLRRRGGSSGSGATVHDVAATRDALAVLCAVGERGRGDRRPV
jgi:hypothetical protein